jgi:ankyrin repeat protein
MGSSKSKSSVAEPCENIATAIGNNNLEQVESMLASGSIDVNANLQPFGTPPLVMAARHGQVAIVEAILNANADIDAVDERGLTACHAAADEGNSAVLQVLLSRKPDLGKRDVQKRTPLESACAMRHERAMVLLINAGAPLKKLCRGLLCQIASFSVDVVQALLDRGVVVRDLRNPNGGTPLHDAASVAWQFAVPPAVIHMLISVCSVDVDACNDEGKTCSRFAVVSKNAVFLRSLIEAGADIDRVKPPNTETPLSLACCICMDDGNEGHLELVDLLLAAGANPQTHERSDPLQTATTLQRWPPNERSEVVSALVAGGADLDAADAAGNTARQNLTQIGVTIDAKQIDAARQRIAKVRLDLVRSRALQVCIGLAPLGLDALQTCEIMLFACGRVGTLISFINGGRLQPL